MLVSVESLISQKCERKRIFQQNHLNLFIKGFCYVQFMKKMLTNLLTLPLLNVPSVQRVHTLPWPCHYMKLELNCSVLAGWATYLSARPAVTCLSSGRHARRVPPGQDDISARHWTPHILSWCYCTVGWSDIVLFAWCWFGIFLLVQSQKINEFCHERGACAAKFSRSKNHRDLQSDFFVNTFLLLPRTKAQKKIQHYIFISYFC